MSKTNYIESLSRAVDNARRAPDHERPSYLKVAQWLLARAPQGTAAPELRELTQQLQAMKAVA